jgi:hypothetical protein
VGVSVVAGAVVISTAAVVSVSGVCMDCRPKVSQIAAPSKMTRRQISPISKIVIFFRFIGTSAFL